MTGMKPRFFTSSKGSVLGLIVALSHGAAYPSCPARADEIVARWAAPADGDWSFLLNWDIAHVPDNGSPHADDRYHVVLEQTGHAHQIELDADVEIDSLTLDSSDAKVVQRSDISIHGPLALQSGEYHLASGTLRNARITGPGLVNLFGTQVPADGRLDAVSIDTDVSLHGSVGVSSHLTLLDGHQIESQTGALHLRDGAFLNGQGEIRALGLPSSSGARFLISGFKSTIGPGITLRNGASAGIFEPGLRISGSDWRNEGTILVDKGMVELAGYDWQNPGPIVQSGGTLAFDGRYSSAAFDSVTRTGGRAIAKGEIHNDGQTLDLTDATGNWEFNAHILGGHVATHGASRFVVTRSSDTRLLDVESLRGYVEVQPLGSLYLQGHLKLDDAEIHLEGAESRSGRLSTSDPM
jgi:hypothetical protein